MSFGLVVRFDLQKDSEDRFDHLTGRTVELVRDKEPGTMIYACHKVEENPSARIFYELYESRGAFEEHERQEHVRRFLTEREQYLDGPPRVEFLEPWVAKGL